MITPCFGMGTSQVFVPKASLHTRVKATKYNDVNRNKERSDASYSYSGQNKFNTIPDSAELAQAKKATPQTSPQNLYLKQKSLSMTATQNQIIDDLTSLQKSKSTTASDLYLPEEIDAQAQTIPLKLSQSQNNTAEFIPLLKTKSSISLKEKTSIPLKPIIKGDNLHTPQDESIFMEMSQYIPEDATSKIENQMKRTLFIIIKKFLRQAAIGYVTEISFADIVTDYLKDIIFDLSNLPHSIKMYEDTSFINLKMQIQYVARQIKNYNNKTVYTSPDDMLNLIAYINQFLKENRAIFFSSAMFTKLNEVFTTAQNCCDIIRNKNIILTSINTPQPVVLLFQPVIENTNKLSNILYSHSVMHAIYDTNGYMDDIIKTWVDFKSGDLNKMTINDHQKAMNYQYAAFLTFLLLFQNSMVAAAIIIDETSLLFKASNPVPVIINIA